MVCARGHVFINNIDFWHFYKDSVGKTGNRVVLTSENKLELGKKMFIAISTFNKLPNKTTNPNCSAENMLSIT